MLRQDIIDGLTQEELLVIIKPYADELSSDMLTLFPLSLKITKTSGFPHGDINMYIDMSPIGGQKCVPIGAIGPAIYNEVVDNYYNLLAQKRDDKINNIIS